MPALRSPDAAATVEIELFGVPRVVTGQRAISVRAATLGEAARQLALDFPALVGTVIHRDEMWLLNGYTFVVDDCFTRDRHTAIAPESAVLLVSSVAGGGLPPVEGGGP
jgi:molybdopterin converting factor small subunit